MNFYHIKAKLKKKHTLTERNVIRGQC